jgi:caa(3)-type oxidase subunit IV
MSQALAITLWMASGAAVGGIVTPLVVQRKPIGTWRGMLAGTIMGLVGNLLVLLPLWLLLFQAVPDSVAPPSWEQDVSQPADGRAARPSVVQAVRGSAARLFSEPSPYVVVFVILVLFTVMETGVAYLPNLPEGVRIGVLGFLAATKVSLVLLYFMHLKSDYRLFALPFALGLVLVVPLLLIVGLTTGEVSAPPSPAQAVPVVTETSGGGQTDRAQLVAEGKQLFSQNCAMCHDGQSGVGPPFSGMVDRADTRVRGESAQQYIHESIVDPSAYVVSGYQDMMPKNFAQKFSDQQINALVAYIMADSGD